MPKKSNKEFVYHTFAKSRVFHFSDILNNASLESNYLPLRFLKNSLSVPLEYFNIFHFCYIVSGSIFLFYYMCRVFERVALFVNCIFCLNNVFYCVALLQNCMSQICLRCSR